METLNQTPRWRWEMIEHLRPATIFDWGTNDEFMWAAYRTTSGWIAKRSIEDGKDWNVKRTAVVGQVLHPRMQAFEVV